PMALVAFADDEPRGDIECGKQRGHPVPHVRATFRNAWHKTGCSRSRAWIWLFSDANRDGLPGPGVAIQVQRGGDLVERHGHRVHDSGLENPLVWQKWDDGAHVYSQQPNSASF